MDATHARVRHLPVRWGLLAASVAVIAAIVWLRGHAPSFDDKLAPFVLSGGVDQRVEARNFAVRVKRLKLARAYRTPGPGFDSGPVQARADGVWLSVLVDVEPTREPGYVSAWLRAADGRTFVAASGDRPRVGNLNFANVQLATGLVGQGAYFFDLPEDALADARLLFFWGLSKPGDMDHLVEIDPGLDVAAVRALREGAQPVIDLVP
ncbi:hypothetical protein [Luteimonas kalidii]|uniref:DUF4384 domain-containing protein n=1 Tax=Luteimonas kalidii TaxID=3042025 RepID=A0ABT6JWH3_9GAMM|nr:hypothetical protein [Luteimonas kalidii]MDH5835046.1 hypothetical protein [Luteimonas kalidii]